MIDFAPLKTGATTFADMMAKLTKTDLYQLTDEMIDTMQGIIADAIDADVVFVPLDPNANDTFGIPEEKDLANVLMQRVMPHTTAIKLMGSVLRSMYQRPTG